MSTPHNPSLTDSTAVQSAQPQVPNEAAKIGIRLLDDAYTAWLAAEAECEQALRAWFEGLPRNRSHTYFAYRAALDREEAAARDLEKLWELAQPRCDRLAAGAHETVQ